MPRPSRIVLLAAAVLHACGGATSTTDQRIEQIERAIVPTLVIQGEPTVTPTLADRMAQLGVPGASVAVFTNGEIEWARGYGFADVEQQRPVTPETLFQAASISKPVAALGALRLVQEGQLDLDEDINARLTSWRVPDNEFTGSQKVTLRGLLTHTAGTTVWGFPGYGPDDDVPSTVGVLDGQGNTDPIRVYKEPGESWRYSGGGYTVAQLLMSDVTGRSFPELMADLVLRPLGMQSSTYEQPLPEARRAESASAYRDDGTKVEGDWHVYPEMAAAGLWTTPSDLARFAMAIQRAYAGDDDTILDRTTARQMLTKGMNDWGLGPVIQGDGARFGHGGSNAGFRAQLTAFVDGGAGAAVMTNSNNGGRLAQEILLTIARAYGWPGLEPEEKVVVHLEPAEYEAVTGTYQIPDIGEFDISYTDGRLLARLFDDETRELLAESATDFFLREEGTPVRFVRDGDDVTGIVVAGDIQGEKVR